MKAAIVVAASILAGSILGAAYWVTQQASASPQPRPRYTFTVMTSREEVLQILYRLDTFTGVVEVCALERLAPVGYPHPSQPNWCAQDFRLKQ